MKRHWEPHELIEDWTLLPAELELLAHKTGATRLGFALLLKYFQIEGRFPQSKHDIPKAVLPHVARQVGVPVDQYLAYDWGGRSIKAHRAQIRAWLGFREATIEDAEQLVSWLCDEVLPHERCQGRRGFDLDRRRNLTYPAVGLSLANRSFIR